MAAEIIVYSNKGWTPCRRAKEYLSRKGIPFTEKYAPDNPAYIEEIVAMGYTTFPVIIIGEQVLSRFFPPEMDAALKAAGYTE